MSLLTPHKKRHCFREQHFSIKPLMSIDLKLKMFENVLFCRFVCFHQTCSSRLKKLPVRLSVIQSSNIHPMKFTQGTKTTFIPCNVEFGCLSLSSAPDVFCFYCLVGFLCARHDQL